MDNIRVMSEVVNFIQGSKKNYDSSTMQGGVYFSKDSKEILLNGESYGNAVPADEEDITRNADGKLQFKDRAYGDGMGYVILRKDKTFAEQVTIPNTIYEIRYQFDLGGASVTIPAGCVLKFIGGQLSNGNLVSQATKFENMSGALNSIVLSEALENFNEIILDENYSCTFKGFHKISLGTDISIIGRHDFILWKDKKLFDFHLNGNGHKIMIDNYVRFISDKLLFSNVQIISSVIGEQLSFYASPLDARGGADVYCVNCSFSNVYISGRYKILNYRDCSFDNCRQIYGWKTETPLYGRERTFENCRFYAGNLNLTSNYAFVQVSYNGWNSKTIFNGCHFENLTGINSDWIDTYDSCNVTITNCFFYSKKMLAGEGLINIKSHSQSVNPSSSVLDTLGSKFNTIVSNNQFIIDLEGTIDRDNPVAIIRVNSVPRTDSVSTDEFNLRYGTLISNNIFTFRGEARGSGLSTNTFINTVIESTMGCKNLIVTNNLVNAYFTSNSESLPFVAYVFFKLSNSVDTIFYKSRMENCIFKDNVVVGNSSSVIYLFPTEDMVTRYLSLRNSNPDNYAKVKPIFNVFQNNHIRCGSSGTAVGRNYNFNTLLDDKSNILTGNTLFVEDCSSFYNTGINKNILNTDSLIPTKGDMIFNENTGKPMWWNGSNWVDANGISINIKREGTTEQRPILTSTDDGFEYYDTTLKKKILWNGTAWVNIDSTDLDMPTNEWTTIE